METKFVLLTVAWLIVAGALLLQVRSQSRMNRGSNAKELRDKLDQGNPIPHEHQVAAGRLVESQRTSTWHYVLLVVIGGIAILMFLVSQSPWRGLLGGLTAAFVIAALVGYRKRAGRYKRWQATLRESSNYS